MEDLVFLKDEKGNVEYGIMTVCEMEHSDTRRAITIVGRKGQIQNNLLQEDIVIPYVDEDEKNEILESIPKDLVIKEKDGNIIFNGQTQKVTAKMYKNYCESSSLYGGHFKKYSYQEIDGMYCLDVTLRTKELTQKLIEVKAKINNIKQKRNPEAFKDKYDATKDVRTFCIWLMENGKIQMESTKEIERILQTLRKGYDNYSFEFVYEGEKVKVSIGDADSRSYKEDWGILEDKFKKYVEEMKEKGEYYIPGTEVERYNIVKTGKQFIKKEERKYLIVDRENLYQEVEGKSIFRNTIVISQNNEIFHADGSKDVAEDIYYNKDGDSEILYITKDNEILSRYMGSSTSWNQKTDSFKRNYTEIPIKTFATKGLVGFIDGNYIRIIDNKGKYITEISENIIKDIDERNGYVVLDDGRIAFYTEEGYSFNKIITPKVGIMLNCSYFDQLREEREQLCENDFNQKGNSYICKKGLDEEELLRLYKENEFETEYEILNEKINERKRREQEEAQRKEEDRIRLEKHVEGKLITYGYPRYYKGDIMVINKNIESTKVVKLFECSERERGRGQIFETGLLNIDEVKKIIRNEKLHIDVPDELMAHIIGKKGQNINKVTEILKERGVEDLKKIILHPHSLDEIEIKLKQIEESLNKRNKKREKGEDRDD